MANPGNRPIVGGLIAFVLLMQGCSNTYKLEALPLKTAPGMTGSSDPMMSVGDQVAIALPKDGQYGETVYAGSGNMVQLAVINCLNSKGLMAVTTEDAGVAVRQRAKVHQWQVKPIILEWEDRATEWSGKPDRIRIELQTTDSDGRICDRTVVSGVSKWATFGGDNPQDMLTPALSPWTARLVKSSTPSAK
jgi:hypothetical protein